MRATMIKTTPQPNVSPDVNSASLSPIHLDQFLCFSLYSANHAMSAIYKPLLKELGLTYPQYLAMVVLWEQDGILVGSLCDRLQLESSTLTPLLKRLEAMKLLTRTRDKRDERQVRIELTPDGERMKKRTAHFASCVLASTGLNMAEIIELQSRIMALRDCLREAAA